MTEGTVWTITKILDWTKQYFAGKGLENPRLDAELLLGAVLHCQRIMLYVHFDQPLEPAELAQYRNYVLRRGRQEPLAYILGHREFLKYDFKVTPAVLVPRPETELLVEKVVQAVKYYSREGVAGGLETSAPDFKVAEPGNGLLAPRILDLGTGSGAIILSLLKELPEATGTALDKSPEALKVARANAAALEVETRVQFLQSDLYAQLPATASYDIIVSNPPYIPTPVLGTLARDVQQEPQMALDGGADGLDFYRSILQGLPAFLKSDGLLALEIGIGQGAAVAEYCLKAGLKVNIVLKDYGQIERIVLATKEGTRYEDFILGLKKPQRL